MTSKLPTNDAPHLFAHVPHIDNSAGFCDTGEWRKDMTAKIPTNDAPPELHKGVEVQLSNGLQATVTDVTPDHCVIDANHTLAGKDLKVGSELVKLQKVCCLWNMSQHALQMKTIQH